VTATHDCACWLPASVAAVASVVSVISCWDDRSNVNTGGLYGLSVTIDNSWPTLLVLARLDCFIATRPVCWSDASSCTVYTYQQFNMRGAPNSLLNTHTPHTHLHTHTHAQNNAEKKDSHTDRKRNTDREINRQTDRQTERQTDTKTDWQRYRKKDRQKQITEEQTDGQTTSDNQQTVKKRKKEARAAKETDSRTEKNKEIQRERERETDRIDLLYNESVPSLNQSSQVALTSLVIWLT